MDTEAGSVIDGDLTISSNHESDAEIRASLAANDAPVEDATADKPAEPAQQTPVEEPPAAEEPAAERDPKTGQFVEKPRNRRDDPRAAVQAAIAKQRDAERRADAAEARALQLERTRATPSPPDAPTAVAQPAADPEPKEADFEDYRLYVKAQARWEARQEYAEREQARTEQTQRQQAEHDHRTVETAWQTRLRDARTADPTFDTRINPATPLSLPMQHVVKTSPVGVQLLEYLSDHQDDAQRLSTLPPQEVLRELGRLEARLDAAPSRPSSTVPPISQAKPPIKPLGTSPQTADPLEITDDLSVEEHIRRANLAERRARAGQ